MPHPALGNMLETAFRIQRWEPLRSIRNSHSQSLCSSPENKTPKYLLQETSARGGSSFYLWNLSPHLIFTFDIYSERQVWKINFEICAGEKKNSLLDYLKLSLKMEKVSRNNIPLYLCSTFAVCSAHKHWGGARGLFPTPGSSSGSHPGQALLSSGFEFPYL